MILFLEFRIVIVLEIVSKCRVDTDMHGCLIFLPIPILGDCFIPIPIPYIWYVTESYQLFTDITLNNWLNSPIPISPIPIPILGDCFIPILILLYLTFPGIGISAHTGYRSNSSTSLKGLRRPRLSLVRLPHSSLLRLPHLALLRLINSPLVRLSHSP